MILIEEERRYIMSYYSLLLGHGISVTCYWEMKALLMRRQPGVYFWGERNSLYSRDFTVFSGPHCTARKILSLLLCSLCQTRGKSGVGYGEEFAHFKRKIDVYF